jgi:hypothetical protein
VVLAKTLTSLAVLSSGPVVARLGPGSSAADDHDAVGVPFENRWGVDEAFRVRRALVRGEPAHDGAFSRAGDVVLDPLPSTPPEVWFGSWGSDVRLRSMAAVADGGLASAYNTTAARSADARARLDGHLRAVCRDPADVPDTVATAWLYVTEDPSDAGRVLPHLRGPPG